MDHEIIVHPGGLSGLVETDALDDLVARFSTASKSEATRRAYASDWRDFLGWCRAAGEEAAPAAPRTVCRYLAYLAAAGRAVTTINRRAAAIACAHRAFDLESPTTRDEVRTVLTGIRNTLQHQPAKKQALTADLVTKVAKKIRPDLTGTRDRAMILLCFGAALRRSELVALDVANLEFHRRGLLVRLLRSKTDQAGEGRTVAVPNGKLKIPDTVRRWLETASIKDGPVFRGTDRNRLSQERLTAGHFARVLKSRCAAVGLDPDLIGGHSPRRGFATTAGDVGADLRLTAKHMRHSKLETTLGYMEDGELFRESVGGDFL